MNESSPSTPPADRIEDQAAAWVLRQDRGFTAAEQDEFLQWRASDQRHAAAFSRHRQNWERLDQLARWLPEHGPRPNRDLLAPPPAPVIRFPRRQAWLAGLSLAAAAAIAVVLWPRPSVPAVAPAPAQIAAIERRTLPDGSVLELNRGAAVAVMFTPAERRVRLERGEVHFTVAKNPARPFIVTAGGVDVRAVGTAFDVRLGRLAVEVLVTEGKVRVDQAVTGSGGRATVVPVLGVGQRTVVPLTPVVEAPQVATVSREQVDQMLAWQPRVLDFTAAPLRSIVAEFNRCNAPVHLVVADPELAEVEVSASLRSDNVEGFIRLLEAGFDVRVVRDADTITLRRR